MTVRKVEGTVREMGEAMIPYRGTLLVSAVAMTAVLVHFRFPHKIYFYGSAKDIPKVVFSQYAHNFKGKIVGVEGSNILLAHRPNWNPFVWGRQGAIRVRLAGIASLSDTARASLVSTLSSRRAHIDLIGYSQKDDCVEAWVWVRRRLHLDSLSHRLVRLGMAEVGPIPAEGFSLTTRLMHEESLKKAAVEMRDASWSRRLWWKIRPPKF